MCPIITSKINKSKQNITAQKQLPLSTLEEQWWDVCPLRYSKAKAHQAAVQLNVT